MAQVDASLVKQLREMTSLGMMDCKKALMEADGDLDKAVLALRTASGAKAASKSGRGGEEGLVAGAMDEGAGQGVLVEVRCETDFVARSEDFQAYAQSLADRALRGGVTELDALLDEQAEQERQQLVQKLGENIQVVRLDSVQGDNLALYVHSNRRIAALVSLRGGDGELAKGIAMHIAAEAPLVVTADQLPPQVLAREREVYQAQAAESGRPPEIQEKIIDGKLRKFAAGVSLVDQEYIVDPSVAVRDVLGQAEASVAAFARLDVGAALDG